MCQCPQRASTHFFLLTDIWEENTDITSVNALNGLLLISSFSRIFGKKTPISQVSMPSTGFYSFLPSHGYLGRKHRYHKCQCPQRASTHFFKGWKVAMGNWKLCQCPQRASTHFLKRTYSSCS